MNSFIFYIVYMSILFGIGCFGVLYPSLMPYIRVLLAIVLISFFGYGISQIKKSNG